MDKKDIEEIIKAVKAQIETTVNGKIDGIKTQMEKHEEELQPVLDVYSTANNIGKFVKWLSGFMLASAVIVAYLKGWF